MTSAAPRHLSLAELGTRLAALPAPPTDVGRITLIVSRTEHGRETPERIPLSPEHGVPGDNWGRGQAADPRTQLTVMRTGIAQLIANGQALTTFGDNLFTDLDLAASNMVPGTRLRMGEVLVEVSEEPHDGCRKFVQRYGADALTFVQAPATRDENRRGVYWTVLEPGHVACGDEVRVVERP